jgi:predicted CopG family antitoxin
MVNGMTTTNGKVVKVSVENYALLKHAKHEMELDSFDDVVSKLLEEHRRKEVSA